MSDDSFTLKDVLAAVEQLRANEKPRPDDYYDIIVHPRSVAAFYMQRQEKGEAYIWRILGAMRDGEGPFDAETRVLADDAFIEERGVMAWYRKVTRRPSRPRGGPPPA